MPSELEFTGERFVPGAPGEIAYEHVHRYAFARRFAQGRRVLDAACGEGYGSALLAQVAAQVTGVDLDAATVAHASATYGRVDSLRYLQGSVTALPLPAASVDLVVSFETVEHLPASDQSPMLAEFARVLAADGVLLMSSPNRVEYSDRRSHHNPFHLHELDRDQLERLVAGQFAATRWYRQRIWLGSMLRAEGPVNAVEVWEGDATDVGPAAPAEAMYFLVLAAKSETALPVATASVSLFSDRDETELARHAGQAREAQRLDVLAFERLAALDRQVGHVRHLEQLLAEHATELARQASLSKASAAEAQRALSAAAAQTTEATAAAAEAERECGRLERAIEAQERIIAYRQSARWWLALPWLRIKLAWVRWRGR